jgi:uncharacterized protein (DUF433 family)
MFDNSFIKALVETISADDLSSSWQNRSSHLMQAFLDYGSETEDNLNGFYHIEYGPVPVLEGHVPRLGFKIKGKDITISDILNGIEDIEIPPYIKEHFPDLTADEWSAATRIATMFFSALERRLKSDKI